MAGFIDALLTPRSVALVGASDDATKTAARPLRFLRQSGFRGKIYPVNPRRSTVLGEKAWPSLASLPEIPEHAYVLAPTEAALDAVEECARLGVKVATILASGFAEAGEPGAARERRLRDIVGRSGIRIVGPGSLGVVNIRERLMLTANAAFAEPDLPAGNIFVASHSGTMIGALVSRGKARGIGFAALVSIGNEVDLGIGEICTATLDWPAIGGYLLFLETIRKSEELRAFALAAAQRGKPVIAYKLGRSAAAAELALSHTGALAGEDDVIDAFLKDCGIARVDTFEALLEGLPLLARVPPGNRKARVGVLTTTGGGAAMVVDQLGVRGVAIEGPSPGTLARLAHAGIEAAPGRIVDLTLAGTRYEIMKGALDVLLSAPEYDLVVAVVGSSARFDPHLAVRPIIDSKNAAKPLAAFLVPEAPEALAQLAQAGVPSFRTPEACADAIAAAFARRKPVAFPKFKTPANAQSRMLDELEAYGLLDRLGIPHAPASALELGKSLSHSIPYPVVAKILSPAIAHKSKAGGVVIGLANAEALAKAAEKIRAAVPGAQRILVQQQVEGAGEALIGYRVDALVGPIVVLAAGGVLTEITRDRSIRLAPVDVEAAREMISEVKALRALHGEALANAIVAFSRLATVAPGVVEAEINPLIVRRAGEGVVAVDALVRQLDAPT
jgi:acyl-CoA synthetase (NDP forming)